MTRTRTDAVVVKPSNNIYTALAGVACVAVLIALVLVFMAWRSLAPDAPLFFGII